MTAPDPLLLASVLAAPADDLPRMVLADWLEEHGDEAARQYAEFVRVQIELARADDSWTPPKGQTPAVARDALRQRERKLLWADVPHPDGGKRSAWEEWLGIKDAVLIVPDAHQWFRRGFIAHVRCRLADFVGGTCQRCGGVGVSQVSYNGGIAIECPHGRDVCSICDACPACAGTGRTPGIGPCLVAAQPVERVEASDVEPHRVGIPEMQFGLYDASDDGTDHAIHPASSLPRQIYQLLAVPEIWKGARYYPSAAAAKLDLSNALIAWAKNVNRTS